MDRAQLRRVLPALLALLLAGVLAAPAAAALSADSMYEPTTVVAIDLQLPPASVAALEAEPDEYVEGTFALAETDGTPAGIGEYTTPLTVGVRLKGGAGSFRDLSGKAAFKVKFNEFVGGQKFLGLKSLTLNNMVQDPSMIHEALVYPAFRAAGLPAPHAGYAYVHLNGVDYGLHLNLETIDDVALKKWFGDFDDPQHLYEGGPEFELAPENIGLFEVDEGDEEELGDLEALIAAANATSPGFSERIAPVADLEQLTRFWAAERYLAHWDGYSGHHVNNYFLLSDPAGVFRMLPWGSDQTLRNWWYTFTGEAGTLFAQCLAEPACFESYREDLAAVEEATTALDLTPRAEALAAQLAPWQAEEIAESERAPHGATAIELEVERVLEFLGKRPGILTKWLGTGEGPPGEEPEEKEVQEERRDPIVVQLPPKPPAPAISGRWELDRSRLGRGLLIARPTVSSDGTVSIAGTIGPPGDRRPACLPETIEVKAGTIGLLCNLTDLVRQRLASRPRTLRLTIALNPDGGEPEQTLTRPVRLPRQAPSAN
jgi:hypothetical protein